MSKFTKAYADQLWPEIIDRIGEDMAVPPDAVTELKSMRLSARNRMLLCGVLTKWINSISTDIAGMEAMILGAPSIANMETVGTA